MTTMQSAPRHQCLIYKGAPSKPLPALVEAMREKLRQNYRCLYLNSPPMVAGLRSYLAAAGVDVAQEVARGRLILSSESAAPRRWELRYRSHVADLGKPARQRVTRRAHRSLGSRRYDLGTRPGTGSRSAPRIRVAS